MLGRYRNSFAEINLQALEQNFKTLKSLVGLGGLAPMVKADAYGHGEIHVSRICERLGARYLGVALIEEGIKLRTAGIQTPILYFGFFDAIGAEAIVKYRLTPVLSSFDQIEKLKGSLHESAGFSVHAEFNTGMQRNGFEPGEAKMLAREFQIEGFLKLEGICTHLISSDDYHAVAGRSKVQEQEFQEIKKIIKHSVQSPLVTHISNSGGVLAGLHSGYEIYRPGISLYGVNPKETTGFSPVLSLKSQVVHLHKVKKNQSVSYGGIWTATKDSVIAVIPLGYADGIPRSMSNKGRVLINGESCPIRGVVCMDYFMVDVTEQRRETLVGDEVVLIGNQGQSLVSVNEWAELSGTIPYEILTGIQGRVPRVYIH